MKNGKVLSFVSQVANPALIKLHLPEEYLQPASPISKWTSLLERDPPPAIVIKEPSRLSWNPALRYLFIFFLRSADYDRQGDTNVGLDAVADEWHIGHRVCLRDGAKSKLRGFSMGDLTIGEKRENGRDFRVLSCGWHWDCNGLILCNLNTKSQT